MSPGSPLLSCPGSTSLRSQKPPALGLRANSPSRDLFQKVQQMSEISVQVTPQHPYKTSPPTCCSHPNSALVFLLPTAASSHHTPPMSQCRHHHHHHHPLRLSWLRHMCQRTITSGFSSAACAYGWQKSHWPLHGKGAGATLGPCPEPALNCSLRVWAGQPPPRQHHSQ